MFLYNFCRLQEEFRDIYIHLAHIFVVFVILDSRHDLKYCFIESVAIAARYLSWLIVDAACPFYALSSWSMINPIKHVRCWVCVIYLDIESPLNLTWPVITFEENLFQYIAMIMSSMNYGTSFFEWFLCRREIFPGTWFLWAYSFPWWNFAALIFLSGAVWLSLILRMAACGKHSS